MVMMFSFSGRHSDYETSALTVKLHLPLVIFAARIPASASVSVGQEGASPNQAFFHVGSTSRIDGLDAASAIAILSHVVHRKPTTSVVSFRNARACS